MSEVKRIWMSPEGYEVENPDGEWVKYEDYSALQQKVDAERNNLRIHGIQIAIDTLSALDASPFVIHALDCKIQEIRVGESS